MRTSSVIGASFLAAAASLPLHLMPLLIGAVTAESRLSAAQAGWMGGAYMLGQLTAVLSLPLFKFLSLSRLQATVAVFVLLGALAISSKAHQLWLLLPWLVLGSACGALQFLATTTAAAATTNREAAFSLRLAITLVVSGVVVFAVQIADGFRSYGLLVLQLIAVLVLLTCLGLTLYREPRLPQPYTSGTVKPTRRFSGLTAVFLLFAGQLGFWGFVVQTVQQRGLTGSELVYAIAACKLMAGLFLLFSSRVATFNREDKVELLRPGLVVAGGVLAMAAAANSIMFFVGLLLWELGFNLLSARTQAAIVQDNPGFGASWLTSAVLFGAAAGLILNGLLIEAGLPYTFVVFACLSACGPFLWFVSVHRKSAR